MWEGRIQNHGGNPYAWEDRPAAVKWAPLKDAVWHGINHKGYTAIYPPAWQLAARAVTTAGDSVAAMKTFLVVCELGALSLLAVSLRLRGLAEDRLLLWAWNPLALVEIAGSGHNEAFGLLWLAAALAALDSGRPWASALAAAVGFQAKFLPGLVALAWARRYRPVQVITATLLALALAWPYRGAGAGVFTSLRRYSDEWRFNETAFAALIPLFGTHAAEAAAFLTLVVCACLAWRKVEAARAALAVAATTILLSPNVLPWYALWLLPPIVLLRSVPALVFTATAALAYAVYPAWLAGGAWRIGSGIRLLEYGVPAALAVASLWQARRSQGD